MSPLVWLACLAFAALYTAAVLFIAKAISTPDDDEYPHYHWNEVVTLPQELTAEQAQHIKDAWASMPGRIEHKPGYRSGRRQHRTLDRLGSLGGARTPDDDEYPRPDGCGRAQCDCTCRVCAPRPPAPTTPDPGLPERVERWERWQA